MTFEKESRKSHRRRLQSRGNPSAETPTRPYTRRGGGPTLLEIFCRFKLSVRPYNIKIKLLTQQFSQLTPPPPPKLNSRCNLGLRESPRVEGTTFRFGRSTAIRLRRIVSGFCGARTCGTGIPQIPRNRDTTKTTRRVLGPFRTQ